jgi:hypothetical protein
MLIQTITYRIDGRTLAMILDTGASVSLVKSSSLESNHITAEVTPHDGLLGLVAAGNRHVDVKAERFRSIDIGAESFANSWLFVTTSAAPEAADGLLGDDYLLHHRVFIETDSQTAFFGLTVLGS